MDREVRLLLLLLLLFQITILSLGWWVYELGLRV